MIIEKGFFNRMKKLQIIRMLGSGMDIGELNEYAYEISFLLIQNIFLKLLTSIILKLYYKYSYYLPNKHKSNYSQVNCTSE